MLKNTHYGICHATSTYPRWLSHCYYLRYRLPMTTFKPTFSLFLLLILTSFTSVFATSPALLLAKTYDKEVNVRDYLISEKYDGVRALWNGKQLISRQGNVYHAPDWFLANFPEQRLDGELWIARGHFEEVVSAVRKNQPIDTEWKKVRYMVFEFPDAKGSFSDRLNQLETLLAVKQSPYIKLIKQFRLNNHEELISKLKEITRKGAEGLMMHRADAQYHTGRSDDLLKVKQYQDAEAIVIKHLSGKGKFTDMLGSLLLESGDGKRFKIGSGFSNKQRNSPPPIGSLVTYKYYGLTKNGIPRFASFLRVRELPN